MTEAKTPPTNTQRVMRVADLPLDRSPARYEIRNPGENPRMVTLHKRQRQILDLLIAGPVFCASPVRISDIVHIHKREIGLQVETKMYPGKQGIAIRTELVPELLHAIQSVISEREAA